MTAPILSGSVSLALLAQGTVCLGAGLTASYLLRRHAARAHRILLACMAAAVLAPAAYLLVRHHGWGLLTVPASAEAQASGEPLSSTEPQASARPLASAEPQASIQPPVSALPPAIIDTVPDAPAVDSIPLEPSLFETTEWDIAGAVTPAPLEETPAQEIPWITIALSGWAVLSALLLGRLLLRLILGVRLIHQAKPVGAKPLCEALGHARDRLGLGGEVDLRSSRNVRSPVIWCWRRVPVLLVHENASPAGKCDWTGVFCHELAHWKRRDHVSGLLAEVLTALLPWHPLTWWVKGRLARLSEDACDDWVIAGGHTGVDYAESLLDLTPQGQMAFLPTVVGKEHTMKARINRIVSDRCGNPVVGKGWALGVSTLVVCIAAGLALAQPGTTVRQPRAVATTRQEPALAAEGRRNIFEWMLQQLTEEARSTEAALAQLGDEPSDRRRVMEVELATLNNQIERIERQLMGVDLPAAQTVATAPPVARGTTVTQPRATRGASQTTTSTPSRVARTRSAQTVVTASSAAGRTTAAQTRATRGTSQATASMPSMVARTPSAEEERLTDLRAQARRIESALSETDDASPRAEMLRNNLAEMERRIYDLQIEQRTQREEAAAARDQARRQRVQSTIDALSQEQRMLQNQVAVPRQSATRPEPYASDRTQQLEQARDNVRRQIAMTERRLAEIQDTDGAEAQTVRDFLETLHRESAHLDLEIAQAQRDAEREASRNTSAVVSDEGRWQVIQQMEERRALGQDRRPATERPLEMQVDELRGQVNGLSEQLQQMQNLLEQLIAAQRREAIEQRREAIEQSQY